MEKFGARSFWVFGAILAFGCSQRGAPPVAENEPIASLFVEPFELTSNLGTHPKFSFMLLGTVDSEFAQQVAGLVVSNGQVRNLATHEAQHGLEVVEIVDLHDNWLIRAEPVPREIAADWFEIVLPTDGGFASQIRFLDLTEGGSVRRLSTKPHEVVGAAYHCLGESPYIEIAWTDQAGPSSFSMDMDVFARDSGAHLFGASFSVGESRSTIVPASIGQSPGDIEIVITAHQSAINPRFASDEPANRLRVWESMVIENDGRCARWKGRFTQALVEE
jgi:hypothetical protein